ncbi:MAG: protease modulator HflC, partial [Treponema sp.]|nr:protease modulator HflC [Treponema sp.]
MKKLWINVIIIAALIIVFFMLGPLYIVNEGTQAVVTRFGEIVNVRTQAGLYLKAPLIDQVTTYPKLILSMDGDSQRIPTKENQFIIVDTTSRWRIADPRQFYQSLKSIETADNRLSDIIDSSVRMVITRNPLSEVVRSSNLIKQEGKSGADEADTLEQDLNLAADALTAAASEEIIKGRRQLSLEIAVEARQMVPEYGIELIDVVPRQIKYADELTESVYNRMIKERNQVAQRNRSRGEGNKADWMGRLDGDLLKIQSDAYRQSEEIKGLADAEASAIYAGAYQKDPEFYAFWKSLESYKTTIPNFDTTYSTNMDY